MRLAVVALICFARLASARPVDRGVTSIVITDETVPRMNSSVVLELHRSGRDFTDGTHVVHGDDVQRLVELTTRSPTTKLDVRQIGITRAEIDARVRLRCEVLYRPCEASWVDAISKADVGDTLSQPFAGEHSDDDPNTTIRLTLSPSQTLILSSKSQHAFMVPWHIDGDGAARETYDVDLARAIARVLPWHAPNRKRIAGDDLLDEAIDLHREGFRFPSKNIIDKFGMDYGGRPLTDPFGGRLALFHTDLAAQTSFSAGGEPGWWSSIAFAPSISFSVFLPQRTDGTFEGGPFLRDINGLAARIRGQRWLEPLFEAPGRVEIEYYDAGYLSPHAYQSALDELRRTDLESAERVKSELWRAVPIHVERSLWLLLPDGSRFCYGGDCSDGAICAEQGRIVRD